jgi:hypothetical protein
MTTASDDYRKTSDNTNIELRVTERIRKFLWKFPKSTPKEACRILNLDYKKYRNMVSVEKCNLKKWMGTKVLGRLPKPLLSAHRVEWSLEKALDMPTLLVVGAVAERRRPRLSDPRPVDEWYVVPNRNNMREFHNEFVTVRVFPKSGTVRVLAGQEMDFEILRRHVMIAFLKAGLPSSKADLKSRLLVPAERHRTFRVGPVTPFKIDFYKDPLGLTLQADGSHPEHIEAVEGWPSWIKPQLRALSAQTEAITALTEQMKLHLEVMKGINDATKDLKVSTDLLRKTLEPKQKPKPFSLEEWLRDVGKRKLP